MYHVPVLLDRVVELLAHKPRGSYLDGTVGGGGHAHALLHRLAPESRLIGLDRDPEALAAARQRLAPFGDRVHLAQRNFKELDMVLAEQGLQGVDGILLDLGVSSHQIDSSERGFSFSADGPLDMRMGEDAPLSARHIVNDYPEQEIAELIRDFGEERHARAIARALVRARQKKLLETTAELRQVVEQALPPASRVKSLARVFQALRIAVNDELQSLRTALQKAPGCLNPGGRLVVIAYHSLEDRLVKQFFKHEAATCVCPPEAPVCTCGKQARLEILTRNPITPAPEEIAANPRSRSAKLRAAKKIEV